VPPQGTIRALRGQVRGPMVGMRVLRAAIRMTGGQGTKQVEIDAGHGFRPKLDLSAVLPDFSGYSESGKCAGRKLNLHV
jgi:hypothetical protein